jgi:hypothetical protein
MGEDARGGESRVNSRSLPTANILTRKIIGLERAGVYSI